MKQKDKLKIFIRFLKKHKVYHKFLSNCKSNNQLIVNEFIKYELKYRCQFINNAFIWSETKEGYKFWYNIYKEWEKIKFLINKY